MAASPTGLPPLNLSSGPAVSDASGAPISNSVSFGPFALNNTRPQSTLQAALPLVLIGGVVWLLTR